MGLTPGEVRARTRLLLRRAVLLRSAEERSGNSRGQLAEVEAALRRMDAGRYGVCERCFEAIGAQSPLTDPVSVLCPKCILSS